MSQKGISGKCFLLSSSQQPSSRKRSSTWWSFGITEEHEVSYSTTEAPTMEPLVAESVILSASGEPVRPERKAQSPTSPRPHASDDEGTFLFHCLTSNRVYLYSPPRVVNLMVSPQFFIWFHFLLLVFYFFIFFLAVDFFPPRSSFNSRCHFYFSLILYFYVSFPYWFIGQFSLSSKSTSSSGGCETRTTRRSRTTPASSVGRLVFVLSCLLLVCFSSSWWPKNRKRSKLSQFVAWLHDRSCMTMSLVI